MLETIFFTIRSGGVNEFYFRFNNRRLFRVRYGGSDDRREGQMKKYICDLCKKEITPADIPTHFEINVGGKNFEIDMHNHCYYKFIQTLKEDLLNETTVDMKNIT